LLQLALFAVFLEYSWQRFFYSGSETVGGLLI